MRLLFPILLAAGVALGPFPAPACERLAATNAWIREPPPVARVAAGYVRLENTGDRPLTITRIESDCCEHTMMHDSVADGDRMRMMHLDELSLAPAESVGFEPGGKHLMLMAPVKPLLDGDSVTIEFFFADGGSARVPFDVVKQH